MTDNYQPGQAPAPQTPQAATDKGRLAPTKKLPSNRITFPKQLDLLRAYGAESMGGTRPANFESVAKLVAMAPTTIGLMNTFLVENGFIERNGMDVMPSQPVVDFARAYSWAPQKAGTKLAPLVRRSWFGQRLLALLAYRPMGTEEAVRALAEDAGASPEYKSQIELLIDYAAASGVIRRDGNQLALGDGSPEAAPIEPPTQAIEPSMSRDDPLPPRQPQSSTATGFMTAEGGVQFHVGIRVTMEEMAGWSPDRITAFFAGLAQVLAAKKGTEEI